MKKHKEYVVMTLGKKMQEKTNCFHSFVKLLLVTENSQGRDNRHIVLFLETADG